MSTVASSALGSRISAPPVASPSARKERLAYFEGIAAGSSTTTRMELDLQKSMVCLSWASASWESGGVSTTVTRIRRPGRLARDCAARSREFRNVSGSVSRASRAALRNAGSIDLAGVRASSDKASTLPLRRSSAVEPGWLSQCLETATTVRAAWRAASAPAGPNRKIADRAPWLGSAAGLLCPLPARMLAHSGAKTSQARAVVRIFSMIALSGRHGRFRFTPKSKVCRAMSTRLPRKVTPSA